MNRYLAQKNIIPFLMSSLSGAIGIIVLWGWQTNNPSLIQITPHSAGMQYNTAISFIAASLAILALCKNYRLLPCILGVFIMSVGICHVSRIYY